MTAEELKAHIRSLADSRCQEKHRDVYEALICVGPGSAEGFSPPCNDCLAETEAKYRVKLQKAHGQKLSAEETNRVRKRLGLV